jgi:hypothetical protein
MAAEKVSVDHEATRHNSHHWVKHGEETYANAQAHAQVIVQAAHGMGDLYGDVKDAIVNHLAPAYLGAHGRYRDLCVHHGKAGLKSSAHLDGSDESGAAGVAQATPDGTA